MPTENFLEAVKNGDLGAVTAQLDAEPALANSATAQGLSAVLLAAYYGHPQIASLLAGYRTNLNIFEAAATGSLARLRQLLEADPGLASAYAPDGFQALGLAAFFRQPAAAAWLVEKGAPVNSPSHNGARVCPLHSAAASGDLEIARLLLEHGADPNLAQADDFVPLHGAAQNGQVAMLELLLAGGADPHARTSRGEGAVAIARKAGKSEAVEFLLRHGAAEE